MRVLRTQTRLSGAAIALGVYLAGVYPAGLPCAQAADAGVKQGASNPAGSGGGSQVEPTEGPTAPPAEPAQKETEPSAQAPEAEVAPAQPVAPPPDPPFLVPDQAIAPPPPPALTYPLSYRGPLRPEQPEERQPEGPSGSSVPTRLETADGVTVLSNRIVTPSTALPATAPSPGIEGQAVEAPEIDDAEEDADGLAAFIRFGDSANKEHERNRRGPGSGDAGLGWVWLAVGILPLLLVPIALLLNRGARRSAHPSQGPARASLEPGPTSSSGPPLSSAPNSPRSRR